MAFIGLILINSILLSLVSNKQFVQGRDKTLEQLMGLQPRLYRTLPAYQEGHDTELLVVVF